MRFLLSFVLNIYVILTDSNKLLYMFYGYSFKSITISKSYPGVESQGRCMVKIKL